MTADQQWCRVTGVDPSQDAGGSVEALHLRRDQPVWPELLVDGRVHQPVQLGEPEVGPPGMPVDADDERGENGRVQAVAHRVDDRQVHDVVIDRVLEAVPCDVVGGLEIPASATCGGEHGQRGSSVHWISAARLIGWLRRA